MWCGTGYQATDLLNLFSLTNLNGDLYLNIQDDFLNEGRQFPHYFLTKGTTLLWYQWKAMVASTDSTFMNSLHVEWLARSPQLFPLTFTGGVT